MGGGLMQLVAYGAQDIYLTGNPQITFFKVVYRRHTNFSMESIAQTWSGTSTGQSGKCTATISRNGDLIHRMYLELDGIPTANDKNPGSAGITSVELEIGGQKIDKHTGQWMETWAQLTQPNPTGFCGTVHNDVSKAFGTQFQITTGMGGATAGTASVGSTKVFVPLQFWFCRNVGLALPLIALQYHEVKVILDHNWGDAGFTDGTTGVTANDLWVDYIYLDTDERRRFAQVSHEYLIEQVQEESWGTSDQTLNFNHPVKELIWTKWDVTANVWGPSTMRTTSSYQLKLNGHDRFASRNLKYFTRTQVLQHHSGVGGIGLAAGAGNTPAVGTTGRDGIAVYSFALKPEEHQPSGTCNFSRIDNAVLEGTGSANATRVYAVNYNVLRIMSGMGGLAYSN
jgi:hypothetical protein